MKVFKTTETQGTPMNSISLYAGLDDLEDILITKASVISGTAMGKIVVAPAVVNSMVVVNCIAMNQKMYPLSGPFNCLKHSAAENVDCVIVGGYPDDKSSIALGQWTGSSYCTNEKKATSFLHTHICHNQYGSEYRVSDLDPALVSLQKDGVWLIPEVLSTYIGGNKVMAPIWEPMIWNLLNELSTLNENVPIIFTTESAAEKFSTAVISSKHRFTLLLADRKEREDSKFLDAAEKIMKSNGKKWFNFFNKSTK